MTETVRKHNPRFLSDVELVSSFCVRLDCFEYMVEYLCDCTGSANTHQIVIGPRGSGKTILLLRVAAEIRRDESLSSLFVPIVFAEESYDVSTVGEFWLECLARLADQTPLRPNEPDLKRSYEELRHVQNDRTLGGLCLGVLQDFSNREGKRLVLIVENLDMMFEDFVDKHAGWRLRHTLQNEPQIILLASATNRFDEIDNPDHALYGQFVEITLRPLEQDACEVLWRTISGRDCSSESMMALRILTGGSPMLLACLARLGANLSFCKLMDHLIELVDDQTEYFKRHLDALPAQERQVYLALAELWKPATAREVAEQVRLDTSKCSAQLARLVARGMVEVNGGTPRRKQYYITERLYNIHCLMRRACGDSARRVEALIQFMEAYYSSLELKGFINRTSRETQGLVNKSNRMNQFALNRWLNSQFLSMHREKSGTTASSVHRLAPIDASAENMLFKKASKTGGRGNELDEIAMLDEEIRRLKESSVAEDLELVATALINKGLVLETLNRTDEAFMAWDEVVRRFGTSDQPRLWKAVKWAQLEVAELNLAMGRGDTAVTAVEHLLSTEIPVSPEIRCQGYLVRARAFLLEGNRKSCKRDIKKALSILSGIGSLPKLIIDSLCGLAVELGPAQLRELIIVSPASSLFLPLTTALEKELGLETRVAKEVEEVAEDIQLDLEERRKETCYR